MNAVVLTIGTVGVLVGSFIIYYWIGKLLGGFKHGRFMTVCAIVLFWVYNSIVNAGGLEELVWRIEYMDGFIGGMVAVLAVMIAVALRGCRNHITIGKEKWLI